MLQRSPILFLPLLALVAVDILLVILLVNALLIGQTESPIPAATESLALATVEPAAPMMSVEQATAQPEPTSLMSPLPTVTPVPLPFFSGPFTYGISYGGRPLVAYRLGNGPSVRAIVGGIHGGYEWNTVALVSDTLQYLLENPQEVPDTVTLYIVPCANPDGFAAGTSAEVGRMNGNLVDLNRNWDYQWQPTATHGTRPVSAGTGPFSEPETASLRDLLQGSHAEMVIFYHSALGQIFSGAGRGSSATYGLAEELARATGYPHIPEGIPGQITTGDAIDYLSVRGIASVEIELLTHDAVDEAEWQRNLAGIRAFLRWDPSYVSLETPLPVDISGWVTYTVQSGEMLSTIALRCGIDWQELARVNRLSDPHLIGEGQHLLVPPACAEVGGEQR